MVCRRAFFFGAASLFACHNDMWQTVVVPIASGLNQGQSFTITGSGFGTKSRGLAPLVWDTGADAAVGAISPQWDTRVGNTSPYLYTAGQAVYNMQNQAVGFTSAGGASIGAPNPYISKILAGCHFDDPNGQDVWVGKTFTPPAYPFCARWEYYYRFDPNWAVDFNSDENLKDLNWNDADTQFPPGAHSFYTNWGVVIQHCISNITQAAQAVITVPESQAIPFATGDVVGFTGVLGMTQINGLTASVASTGGSFGAWTFTLNLDTTAMSAYAASLAISGISQAATCTVTLSSNAASNPLSVGIWVRIVGATGMTWGGGTDLNNHAFEIHAVGGSQGAWTGTLWTRSPNSGVPVDTSASPAYGGGATLTSGAAMKPQTNTTTLVQSGTDAYTNSFFQGPNDANGHNSSFWNNMIFPLNPTYGWIKKRVEMCVTTATGLGGGGYFNAYDSSPGVAAVNKYMFYAGSTDTTANPMTRCISMGNFCRDRGPNNYRYFSQAYYDVSDTGVTGQVAAVYVGDNATYGSCTVLEPQIPTSWTNTAITFTFWKGSLASGSTGYIYVCRETDAPGTALSVGSARVA